MDYIMVKKLAETSWQMWDHRNNVKRNRYQYGIQENGRNYWVSGMDKMGKPRRGDRELGEKIADWRRR